MEERSFQLQPGFSSRPPRRPTFCLSQTWIRDPGQPERNRGTGTSCFSHMIGWIKDARVAMTTVVTGRARLLKAAHLKLFLL